MTTDWEEQLSRVIGDVLAHRLSNGLRGVYKSYKRGIKSFEKNLTQYLQEEANLLPPREALEDFFQDVQQVHDAVNQCEIKLHKFISTKLNLPTEI